MSTIFGVKLPQTVQPRSLSFQLLFSAAIILSAFFALVAFVLEQGFRSSTEQALKQKLQVHIYSLLSVAELSNEGRMKMPESLREPRLSNLGSGLYASIHYADNVLAWRSLSTIGVDLSYSFTLKPGESIFRKQDGRYIINYAVIWENEIGIERYFVFSAAEDGSIVTRQVESFKVTVRTWLLLIGVLLVSIQFLLLHWSLKPLRTIATDLEAIEAGKKNRLDGVYPSELSGLARNLNALIASERAHLERYRNTLSDLAHSLKTPLAILRGCNESQIVNKATVAEQISRMNEIVEYQLQKAAAKGDKNISSQSDIIHIVNRVISSLNKVYQDKQINFILDNLDGAYLVYCEQGDVYEIVGNLLDNAAKWCENTISIQLEQFVSASDSEFSCLLIIEDDGPGIPANKLNQIFLRGVRADENIQGHGIGLAVVNELITLLGGKLQASRSEKLGGLKWLVYLP